MTVLLLFHVSISFGNFRILREINFGHFEAPKTAILTISVAMNFEFMETFDIFKYEFYQKSKAKASQIIKIPVFDLLKSAKIDFM